MRLHRHGIVVKRINVFVEKVLDIAHHKNATRFVHASLRARCALHTHAAHYIQIMKKSFPKEGRIFFVKTNPKRKGGKSRIRFDRYMAATTVEHAKELGMSSADLRHDYSKGFCWFEGDGDTEKGKVEEDHEVEESEEGSEWRLFI